VVVEGSSLASRRWTFVVLDTDVVNVCSTPGETVLVTRGALALIEDEAELAGVVAHEVGHVMARHAARSAAAGASSPDEAGQRLYAAAIDHAFDPTDEIEADNIAVALADHAGYRAAALASFLPRLTGRDKRLIETRIAAIDRTIRVNT